MKRLVLLFLAACSGSDAPRIVDAGVDAEAGVVAPPPVPPPPPPPPPPVVDAGPNNGIDYHGGPVMTDGSLGVYLVWYGDWRDTTKALTREFVSGLNGSPYFAINKGYCQADGKCVSGALELRGEFDDAWSLGRDTVWEDSEQAAFAIVAHLTVSQVFPANPSAVFVVMVSKGQKTWDGACQQWCGWHDHFTLGANDLKIGVVWDPEGCPLGCSAFHGEDGGAPATPNGDLSADSAVSVLAHEIEEMATDPDVDAWMDSWGAENADKCAWDFGDMYRTSNGALANMKLGQRDWLVQQNWVNAGGGYCGLAAP